MIETAVDHLIEAANEGDGVEFDGLHVQATDDGYEFRTPQTEQSGLSAEQLRDVASEQAAYVTNWHFFSDVASDEPARWAFLRWLEHADEDDVLARYGALDDGRTREWGQLHVTVERDDTGARRYDLRHVDDVDTPDDELRVHEDPLDARDLVRHDETGRYRPLKTAPTLRSGWVFPDLGPAALVETVEFVYPATIANWHREREGELDVSHWHETVERQTGIYGVVETWDRQEGHEHVDWVAEACCADSQCLKRREWEYDDETDLDVDGGDGEFPCREPCSMVISAARRWTKLEAEQSQTYEFELTPSEKEQIEEIIDAVADDRTDEIREADTREGANRYRARFLRAKRFDDDGNLCGVPTEREDDQDESGH
ncbi:DR2241 family protein [Halorientalis brevis]|uniref:DR2241 family protein n=1 Tax=Halorientalis brevis TaxID=1126241 RepID=A0ABD6CAG7_9EURY|nr:DR2241 family protein [Halorientalis brevis]